MDIVAQEKKKNKRYLPHTLDTRVGAVKLYRHTHDIDFVLRPPSVKLKRICQRASLKKRVQLAIAI